LVLVLVLALAEPQPVLPLLRWAEVALPQLQLALVPEQQPVPVHFQPQRLAAQQL
jgi:hypothetical protein